MDIYVGVDGTGDSDDATYASAFENSYVNRIFKEWHTTFRSYTRGPSMSGSSTGRLSRDARVFAQQFYEVARDGHAQGHELYPNAPRIFLAGYSRGGAAVIQAAAELQDAGTPVHCLLLFDAVDRTTTIDRADVIPSNVALCFHAVRDPAAGSREAFGNCGRRSHSSVAYAERLFYCTHGAMGGTPWTEVGDSGRIEEMTTAQKAAAMAASGPLLWPEIHRNDYTNVTLQQEQAGTQAVWSWMSGKLRIARESNRTASISPMQAPGHNVERQG